MNNFSIANLIETSSKADSNLKWFLEKNDMLVENYQGKYVAIDNEDVIDSDNDIHSLLQKLQVNPKHSNSTLIQYINDRNVKLTVD
jgi:P pilus assembly chaperone PapD